MVDITKSYPITLVVCSVGVVCTLTGLWISDISWSSKFTITGLAIMIPHAYSIAVMIWKREISKSENSDSL